MEYRFLGGSGFRVPVLTLGTGTFGGGNEFFKAWGTNGVDEATKLVDICLDAGLTMFDSADVIQTDLRKRSWAKRSNAVETASSFRPKQRFARDPDRTTSVLRAGT